MDYDHDLILHLCFRKYVDVSVTNNPVQKKKKNIKSSFHKHNKTDYIFYTASYV